MPEIDLDKLDINLLRFLASRKDVRKAESAPRDLGISEKERLIQLITRTAGKVPLDQYIQGRIEHKLKDIEYREKLKQHH
jgi:hypothetical protein